MEYLDIYDNNKNKLNRKVLRGTSLKENEHILIAIIFIENDDAEFLIQKTSLAKSGKYSSTGGHVLTGEDSYHAIIRETKEELGLDISKENIIYINTLLLETPFFDIYYLKKNIDLNKLIIQTEEVSSITNMTKEEILSLIEEDNIIKSHGLAFKEVLKYKQEHIGV